MPVVDQCRSEAFPSDHNWRLAATRGKLRSGVARWRSRRASCLAAPRPARDIAPDLLNPRRAHMIVANCVHAAGLALSQAASDSNLTALECESVRAAQHLLPGYYGTGLDCDGRTPAEDDRVHRHGLRATQ